MNVGRAKTNRREGIAKRARNKWIVGRLRAERISGKGRHEVPWFPRCRRKWRNSGPCLKRRFVVGMVAIVRLRISRGRIPRIHHKSIRKSVVTRESGS